MLHNVVTTDANTSDKFLSTKQAARALGLSHRTLEDWRIDGFGPLFIKAGRRVLYRWSDLMAFVNERVYQNTGAAQAT